MEIREVALLAVEQAFKAIFQNTPEQEPLTATGLSLSRQRAMDLMYPALFQVKSTESIPTQI